MGPDQWSVYTENDQWVIVESKHQLVAYYLEILPVADELMVTAADWGKKGDGSTSGDYLDPKAVVQSLFRSSMRTVLPTLLVLTLRI